jgi:hypothetical protein
MAAYQEKHKCASLPLRIEAGMDVKHMENTNSWNSCSIAIDLTLISAREKTVGIMIG